jgi:tRNA(Leu) C34 or U34 (ribose-2'-O)-methylase TrmL
MKYLHHYHPSKFSSFSPERKLKAIDRLLLALDEAMGDEAGREELVRHILDCLELMDPDTPPELGILKAALVPSLELRELSQALDLYRRGRDSRMSDADMKVYKADGIRSSDPHALQRASALIVIADNLRSAFNLGSIFRSCECLGIPRLFLCGTTPAPDNPAFLKTARRTAELLEWEYFSSTGQALRKARAEGYRICALETAEGAESVFDAVFEPPLALVVGNESLGIPEGILASCDQVVALPVQGWKNSLNVGVAFAVCAYQAVFGGRR